MGLFTGLLTLPLAPVRGVMWVAEQVTEEAQKQLYDEDRIRGELLQLELDAEEGKIGEEEQRRMEDELFERLAVAQVLAAEGEESSGWLSSEGATAATAVPTDDASRPAKRSRACGTSSLALLGRPVESVLGVERARRAMTTAGW